ncbi:MAG TPA: Gfo/Idh/MocA family oxidoreductase [Chitinophagaceae bacterium]|nr:Gfo/Idh/MocA family oxidoreductase [Chitinophagaceae bacterium]
MPEKQAVRWAILGAGKIAHKFAQDFKAVTHGELVAVAARDKPRAQDFATQYGIPHAYTYDELYASSNVDAVYIATTHNFHYEQCLHCINAGKAVLCEKPITINDGEFKKLRAAAREKNVFIMEAMWTYFLPSFLKAAEWLQAGRIGTLKAIQADFGFAMPYNPEGRLYNPALAGGALLDLGVYAVAFATFFGNAPDAVVASGVLSKTGVDETTGMLLQFGNVSASLFTSMTTRLRNKALRFGEMGYIEIPDFWKAPSATLYNGEYEVVETFIDDRTTWGYHFEIQHATDLILAGALESNVVPHASSNTVQEVMTNVRRQIGFTYPQERI